MPTKNLNLDRERSLQDPISFTVKGQTFTCIDITDDVMSEIEDITQGKDLGTNESLVRQIAVFTGTSVEAIEKLELTLVQKSAIVNHIMGCVRDPLGNR